jgi:hypothetical protein
LPIERYLLLCRTSLTGEKMSVKASRKQPGLRKPGMGWRTVLFCAAASFK